MLGREMSVSGSFYPDNADELKRYFEYFDKIYNENFSKNEDKPRAVIVPHAGYIYSGFTASVAYRVLQNCDVKTCVVIGPSHKVAFDGISICEAKNYETPFGKIDSDLDLTSELKDTFPLQNVKESHAEHSTETQFPFIKHYLKNSKLVELVYSKVDTKKLSLIIDFVLSKKDTVVIISTDLSHFYDLESAKKLDNICLKAINNLDIKMLHSGCEACGKKGVEAVVHSAKKTDLKYKLLDYRTSADFSKDESRVVGYMSAYFY